MIIFGVLFVILQVCLWKGDGSLIDVMRLRRAIEAEQGGITKLTQRNQSLDAEVQLLKTEFQVFEDRARTDLGMIKKGETFCLVIEPAR